MHDDTGPVQTGNDGVRITVQVAPDVARALAGVEPPSRAAQRLIDVASRRTSSLEPVHPGVDDPSLATWFTLTVRTPNDAERLLDELLEDPAVEAAYIKPTDFPP
jgi:hypothetical protein